MWWKNPKRSKFGSWLDRQGVTQVDFAKHSKISSATMWRLCTDKEYIPSAVVMRKIMSVAKTIDKNMKTDDFFNV
ncbi:transcriptional regulator [Bacillus megaterium]|uniref:helix-turn-helix domain-containing protein n=1 Tax=Priestia megaterium TaxID=1404 RepID=UPI001293C9EB|nr:helix-turn-helix domain-containing protein [Priestia megaterium]MQR84339.1 transcriptional regulator [Priestia megaterium]